MQTMYPAFFNSPETVTLGAISPTATTVTVQDITKIPEPPNLLVIGGDRPDAETVLLTAVSGSTLTIQRAVNGSARTWTDRTTIARNFTAYDHDAFKANIEELNTSKLNTDGNGSNVTAAFSQASTKANIATGEKLSVIFGKLMKWYASFGAAAWMGTGTTSSTVALGNHTHTAAAVGAVPTSRTVNGKVLSADVTLAAADVGARADDWLPTLPDVGGSRENILINWDFRNPVNQIGLTSWNAGVYTVDCWKAEKSAQATYNIQLTANGLVLAAGNAVAQRQLEFAYLDGRLVTASALISGELYSVTFTWTAANAYTGFELFSNGYRFAYNGEGKLLQLHNYSGAAGLVTTAIKLEIGAEQTLAHRDSAGNWVLNDPTPNPQQELAKCQRYQYRNTTGYSEFIRASSYNANTIYFDLPVPVPMRANPVIESYGAFEVRTISGTAQSGFTFSAISLGSTLRITAEKSAHGLTDAMLNAASVLFNANL